MTSSIPKLLQVTPLRDSMTSGKPKWLDGTPVTSRTPEVLHPELSGGAACSTPQQHIITRLAGAGMWSRLSPSFLPSFPEPSIHLPEELAPLQQDLSKPENSPGNGSPPVVHTQSVVLSFILLLASNLNWVKKNQKQWILLHREKVKNSSVDTNQLTVHVSFFLASPNPVQCVWREWAKAAMKICLRNQKYCFKQHAQYFPLS